MNPVTLIYESGKISFSVNLVLVSFVCVVMTPVRDPLWYFIIIFFLSSYFINHYGILSTPPMLNVLELRSRKFEEATLECM